MQVQFSQHNPVGDADGGDSVKVAPRGPFTSDDEYRDAIATTAVHNGWVDHLWRLHWQVYAIATFSHPASAEYARSAGAAFIRSLGPSVYGAVAWGEGALGGRHHIHLLLGGMWQGRIATRETGLNQIALNIQLLRRKWRHGIMTKVERFDPNRKSTYLVDHHEVEVFGRPKRHRFRKKAAGEFVIPHSREPKE